MKSALFVFLSSLLSSLTLHAEITLDGTLGSRIALEGPDYTIGAKLGQQHGSNLFHSFEKFNLNATESATFSGPNHINSIISRVTGGYASSIDGTLRSLIPNADVYFINPAGIMFGANAKLDVQGSFHASTADTLHLQYGGEFNARHPQESLLTVAPVSAFGFLTDSSAALHIQGSHIEVPAGNNLSFVASNLQINQAKLTTNGGNLHLASIAQAGKIQWQPEESISSLQLGDITIRDSQIMTTGKPAGGDIDIHASHLLIENSSLEANTISKKGKDIDIQVDNLTITHGGRLSTTTFGAGNSGDIKIRATDSIRLSGIGSQGQGSALIANSGSSRVKWVTGDGGTIELQARQLELTDGAQIGATTFGSGDAGKINLKIAERITFSGEDKRGISSGILALTTHTGSAGNIELETNQFILREGTRISSQSSGSGQSGDIQIQASDLVRLEGMNSAGEGSFIIANASGDLDNAGDGGTIALTAGHLQLSDGAQIGTATFGTGQGGMLNINVSGNVKFSGEDKTGFRSGLFTTSDFGATGNAGTIRLNAGNLSLTDKAEINVSTLGNGQGGHVEIQADTLTLTENSTITAHSESQSNAGHLVLKIAEQLKMRNSAITTQANSADGGNILLTTPSYLYLVNSQISTSVNKDFGSGGNITLKPEFLVLDNSQVFAKAKKGQGGHIDITTTGIYNFSGEPLTDVINASSELGVDGIVTVDSPDVNLDEFLVILPASPIDARLKGCDIQQEIENPSTFRITQTHKKPPLIQ